MFHGNSSCAGFFPMDIFLSWQPVMAKKNGDSENSGKKFS
jgi:hypothetical protein